MQLLNEHLDIYREMPINEMMDQFGVDNTILQPVLQKESSFHYDIMIIVDWENQNVSVDAFLTESNRNDVEGSKTIAQERIVRFN